jgi:hypothetical protein
LRYQLVTSCTGTEAAGQLVLKQIKDRLEILGLDNVLRLLSILLQNNFSAFLQSTV